jgi:hypothetical protein
MYIHIHTPTHRVFQKELYNGIPNVAVWRVLWKLLHLDAHINIWNTVVLFERPGIILIVFIFNYAMKTSRGCESNPSNFNICSKTN